MNQQLQSTPLSPVDRSDELDFIGLWKVLIEYKLLIIVFTTLTTLGATYYASTLPTIYKTEVVMLSPTPPPSLGKLAGFAGLTGISLGVSNAGAKGEQALARLRTRSFLTDYIKKENLKPILFAEQWNKETKHWIDQQPSDREAFKLLSYMISAVMDPRDKAGLVIFSIEWKNPINLNKLADITNNLVGSMNINAKQRAIVEAKNSISFLEKELEHTNVLNSQTILYSMIERQMQKIMLANVRDEFVFKVIDPAVSPEYPENNFFRKITIALFGFILSLLFSSIAVLVFERNIKNVKNNKQ